MRAGALVSSLAFCAAFASSARATQPMPQRAERIFTPGKSAASDDTADAIVTNPANLGFLPSYEFRWTGVRCPDTQKIGCGHAFEAATPLFFGLATGLRVDYVTPPASGGPIYAGIDYSWLTWALAWNLSRAVSFGTSIQHSFSSNPLVNGLWTLTAGVTLRPDPHFSLAVVARDFTRPTLDPVLGNRGQPILDRSYIGSVAFRPTGRRAVELALDLRYLDGTTQEGSSKLIPRASLAFDVPGVGRARGDVEVSHFENDTTRAVVATAGMEIYMGRASLGGGALFGSGLGNSANDNEVGEWLTASFAGYRNPGLPELRRAVSIRMESTPGTRGHVALLRRLWKISEDPKIAGVTLILRAEPASSYAHAEELADAIRVLRARGKKVLCSFEDNGAKSLYVCANADRIVINPAGSVRYSGIKSTYIYLAGLLEKLGIRAEFVRIGAHKGAPEQFTNTQASDVTRADHEDLIREVEAVFVRNASVGRGLPETKVREATLKGPFVAQEAKDAGFVDSFAFDDEIDRATRDLVGKYTITEPYEAPVEAPSTFGPRAKVALLYVDGDMVDGRSQTIPLIDMKLVGSYTIADTIRAVREDSSIKSVVLRIESPGGSSMSADVMWRELRLLAEQKPLIVSMGSVAASGGYYIASAGKEIYALPLTVTGSIGIFYGKADLSGLLAKIGVTTETYKTAPRADAESLYRGFTPDERAELEHKVGQFYDVFLDRVSQGRHMTKAEVDAVGQGRVWTGQEAIEHKLVDKLGGLREALDEARKLANLPSDAPIEELPVVEQSLVEQVLGINGVSHAMTIDNLPVQVRDVARAVAPMVVYSRDTAMARMMFVPQDD